MNYWLVKSEPFKYSWQTFLAEGETFWDGVRNYQARNNMKGMKVGDLVLYYHSNEGKEVVGVAQVSRESYQDPTTDDKNWVVVNLKPVETLRKPVTLKQIKDEPFLSNMELVKQGRLSVTRMLRQEFDKVLEMGA